MKQYVYRNKVYSITKCLIEDIPSHIEKVSSYWNTDEIPVQEERMLNAINNNTAFKLIDENNNTLVFVYYDNTEMKRHVESIAGWWINIKMFAIFGVWLRTCTNIQYVYINPHRNELIPKWEFIVDHWSIHSYHANHSLLRIDLYSKLSKRLYDMFYRMKAEELKHE